VTYSVDHDEGSPMGVEIKYDEDLDQYLLGGDVEGSFIPFVTSDGAYVRSRLETARNAEPPPAEPVPTPEPPAETQPQGEQPPAAGEPDGDETPPPAPAEGLAP
jgi:hypothetical protein